jgi:hypothetical protein
VPVGEPGSRELNRYSVALPPSETSLEKREPSSVVDVRVWCGMMLPALLMRCSSMSVVWFR